MNDGMEMSDGMVVVPPKKLVWCGVCEVGYPISPLLSEDDLEKKLRKWCQKNHGVILLEGIAESFWPNKQIAEPVGVTYFNASGSDGHVYRVKQWRVDINQPLAYRAQQI